MPEQDDLTKVCPSCGALQQVAVGVCRSCGAIFESNPYDAPPPIAAHNWSEPPSASRPYSKAPYPYAPQHASSGVADVCAVISFVCGLVGLITICVWFLAGPLSIAAILLGIFGIRSRMKGLSIAGLVIGILALLGVISFYGFLFAMSIYSR